MSSLSSGSVLDIGAFGKLPIAREFLRHRANLHPAQCIVSLLEEGNHHFAGLEPDDAAATLMGLPLERGGILLTGIWPSTDEGGLRPWAFALFVELCAQVVEALGTGLWESVGPVADAMAEIRRQAIRLPDALAFDHLLENSSVRLSDPEDRATNCASISLLPWVEKAFGDTELFALALWRLRQALTAGGEGAGRVDRGGIRVPIIEDVSWTIQVDAWSVVIGRSVPLIVVPRVSGGTGTATFFFSRTERFRFFPGDGPVPVRRSRSYDGRHALRSCRVRHVRGYRGGAREAHFLKEHGGDARVMIWNTMIRVPSQAVGIVLLAALLSSTVLSHTPQQGGDEPPQQPGDSKTGEMSGDMEPMPKAVESTAPKPKRMAPLPSNHDRIESLRDILPQEVVRSLIEKSPGGMLRGSMGGEEVGLLTGQSGTERK